MTTVYCVETFDGELISHTDDGPLLFLDANDAGKYIGRRSKSWSIKVFEDVDKTKPKTLAAFTHYPHKAIEGEAPEGGVFLRQFRGLPAYVPAAVETEQPPDDIEPIEQGPSLADEIKSDREGREKQRTKADVCEALDKLGIQYDGRKSVDNLVQLLPENHVMRTLT